MARTRYVCMMTSALHKLSIDGVQIDPDAVAAPQPVHPVAHQPLSGHFRDLV